MEPPPSVLTDSELTPIEALATSADSQAEIAVNGPEGGAWRDELSARLSRYRARHKAPPPRYPSLRLPFDTASSFTKAMPASEIPRPTFGSVSDQALALERLEPEVPEIQERPEAEAPASGSSVLRETEGRPSAKIIEFPRFAWAPPPPPPDQLAEPVGERPRILEVPEVAPPPPALGGITIEPVPSEEVEKRPGIDFPLQGASLSRRIVASLIDGLIVGLASALFGFIFWKVAGIRPPQVQFVSLVAGGLSVFWAVYQYVLVVYAATTPGLRLAGLELARFDGSRTSRSLRRWRIFASYLSALSLGMGYAWVFLDEDTLCWHDRITHTYLAPISKNSNGLGSGSI